MLLISIDLKSFTCRANRGLMPELDVDSSVDVAMVLSGEWRQEYGIQHVQGRLCLCWIIMTWTARWHSLPLY